MKILWDYLVMVVMYEVEGKEYYYIIQYLIMTYIIFNFLYPGFYLQILTQILRSSIFASFSIIFSALFVYSGLICPIKILTKSYIIRKVVTMTIRINTKH